MLLLPRGVRARLEGWIAAGYPHETCGLLVGRSRPDGIVARAAYAARNLNTERSRDRYELDPEDFLRVDRAAAAAGEEVVGVWHSHPDHLAIPSETDRAAAWEGWCYLIARVTPAGTAEMRAWRLDPGGRFQEVPLGALEDPAFPPHAGAPGAEHVAGGIAVAAPRGRTP